MKFDKFSGLEDALQGAEHICAIEREDLPYQDSLLIILEHQPEPYYNYILCSVDENSEVWPFYVGYTGDLYTRMNTHAQRVEFDMVFLYHSDGREPAFANEQTLIHRLGTQNLFNGTLTQLPHVSRQEILDALSLQELPPDRTRMYAEEGIIRRTYYLNPVLLEVLRSYAYEQHTEVSETLRLCLIDGIPEEHLEAAYAKVHAPKQVAQ